jgi:HlyD family secretion protein
MKHRVKKALALLTGLALAGAAAAWVLHHADRNRPLFRTVAVKRGDLVATISATGTVEPEELVDVGAQVAGQIIAFGKDKNGKTIDYGSIVEEGTVLAQIDDSLYAADVAVASAQLEQAQSSLERARADLEQSKAKLRQAERDWNRAQKLGPSEALAESSYDAYQSAYETASANVKVGEAAIAQAKAAVAQARATLERAKRNLGYCTIRSPVKGVIIDRRVNIGQTVVSSLNAPSLFLIAKDLHRMQVWVSVNEADIGSIHPGQPVSFAVDAYPGEIFRGEVAKIRLNATMTQNVVAYIVEVTTDNSSGKLLPYLTANVQFELGRRTDVWLVPNAALRWFPPPGQMARQSRDSTKRPEPASAVPGEGPAPPPGQAGGLGRHGTLWIPEGELVRPMEVALGLSDGTFTEVQGQELREGLEVVVGLETRDEKNPGASPFAPQLRTRSSPSARP